jgi:general secretion pathway protein G
MIDPAMRRTTTMQLNRSIRSTRPDGFTLIEVLVVVVILGILAAVVVPRIMDQPDKAAVVRAKQDVQSLVTTLNIYKLDNFNYPSTQQGLEALVQRPTGAPDAPNWKEGGYLDRLPRDPWGNPYEYLSPGRNGEFDVYTLGKDGQPGGDGFNADVGNWNLDG